MRLIDRIKSGNDRSAESAAVPDRMLGKSLYNDVKTQVHFSLVEKLDLASVTSLPRDQLSEAVRTALGDIAAAENIPLNDRERSDLVSDLLNEILGLGPIETIAADDSVQDILVNGHDQVYIESEGVLHKTDIQFRDDDHLLQIIDKIVSRVGRRVDESSPMVDARLPDGSRVNVIIPPVALNGPSLSIRKFGKRPMVMDDLIRLETLMPEMLAFLQSAVLSKLNILISGGTGAGKTTLLNTLSAYIPKNERIITIEDNAELRLDQPHTVSLESRPPNIEGAGEVRLTDLVKNSLRMRPDRIIVGEARGEEAMDMLQAMNTGHPGSMSTIHANSPRDALSRMEVMVGMGALNFSEKAMRALIGNAVHIVVQLARLTDGARRVVSISEITGIENDEIRAKDIFTFEQTGVDDRGRVQGVFKGSGQPPRCLEHIRSYGFELDPSLFDTRLEVN